MTYERSINFTDRNVGLASGEDGLVEVRNGSTGFAPLIMEISHRGLSSPSC